MKKVFATLVAVLLLAIVVIQFLPVGARTNPPVAQEPEWDSSETRETFMRACGDCHSNETKWPWYTSVAPVKWFVVGHVNHGRGEFNVSEFNKPQRHAHESAEEVEKGKMPLPSYLRMHPEANLTEAEKAAFLQGLRATFGDDD